MACASLCLHGLRQLVLDRPGRGLGHAQAAGEFDAGDALLALGQVIHGAEPGPQRHLGRGEESARDQRGLVTAGAALIQAAGLHLAMRVPSASRALDAPRPAPREHHGAALLFGAVQLLESRLAEAFLKLHRIPCHRCLSHKP
jgi:hypothetical protein